MSRISALLGKTVSSSVCGVSCAVAVLAGSTGWAVAQVRSGDNRTIELAQAAQGNQRPQRAIAAVKSNQVTSEARRKEMINSWTVGLAAGRTEGAPLQFAAELADGALQIRHHGIA